MPYLDNPAGRLFHWLDLGVQQTGKSVAAIDSWCTVFGLDPADRGDRVLALERGVELMQLAKLTRREAGMLPPEMHPDLLLENFHQVESTVDQFLILGAQSMQGFFAGMEGTGWSDLRKLDAYLHSHRPEAFIDDEKRLSLLEQVRSLIEQTRAATDLGDEPKAEVLARLYEIELALLRADVVGSKEVKRATDAFIGLFNRRPDFWAGVRESVVADAIISLTFALASSLGLGIAEQPLPAPDDRPQIVHNVDEHVEYIDHSTKVVIIKKSPPAIEAPAAVSGAEEAGGSDDKIYDFEIVDDEDGAGGADGAE